MSILLTSTSKVWAWPWRPQGEAAAEREQRRGGQRPGGADEPAPRAGEARETRRPAAADTAYVFEPPEERMRRPGGAAGGQARRSALPARRSHGARRSALGAQLGARRSALGALIRVAQTTSNHFAQFDTIAAPLPVRAS